jgi:hypothetical protein
MPDAEIKILFRTEAELAGATALQQSLERQIGAAKALGQDTAELDKKHQRVTESINAHVGAAKRDQDATEQNTTATKKAVDAKQALKQAFLGLGTSMTGIGPVLASLLNPFRLIAVLAGAAATAIVGFFRTLRQADEASTTLKDLGLAVTDLQGAIQSIEVGMEAFITKLRSMGQTGVADEMKRLNDEIERMIQLETKGSDLQLAIDIERIKSDASLSPTGKLEAEQKAREASRVRLEEIKNRSEEEKARRRVEMAQQAERIAIKAEAALPGALGEKETADEKAEEMRAEADAAKTDHAKLSKEVKNRLVKLRDQEEELEKWIGMMEAGGGTEKQTAVSREVLVNVRKKIAAQRDILQFGQPETWGKPETLGEVLKFGYKPIQPGLEEVNRLDRAAKLAEAEAAKAAERVEAIKKLSLDNRTIESQLSRESINEERARETTAPFEEQNRQKETELRNLQFSTQYGEATQKEIETQAKQEEQRRKEDERLRKEEKSRINSGLGPTAFNPSIDAPAIHDAAQQAVASIAQTNRMAGDMIQTLTASLADQANQFSVFNQQVLELSAWIKNNRA